MDSRDRAQSEVIGTVLLIGLTITAVGVTVAIGSAALADAQASADVQRVEGAMTQVDSKTSLVAHGGSTSQRVRLDPGSTANARIDGDAGRMRIEVETEDGDVEARNVTLGAVVYERGDDRVAYQGGGVWRANEGGSWMVSPPEFHYRGDTLTLPLVTIDGEDGRFRDSAVVTRNASRPDQLFPSGDVSNPLLGGNVTVTVESEYAQAWGRFFESRTEANVTRLADDEVEVRLRTVTTHPALNASVSSVAQSQLALGGVTSLYADSYDSSQGAYDPDTAGSEARIRTSGQFQLVANGGGPDSFEVRGDVVADSFNPSQNSSKWKKNTNITGDLIRNSGSIDPGPTSGAIAERIAQVKALGLDEPGECRSDSEFDDGGTHPISEDTCFADGLEVSDGTTLRIEDGSTVHVQGGLDVGENGRVVFDSTSGDIEVLLEDELSIESDGRIDSVGGGRNVLSVDAGIDVQDQGSIETDEDTRLDLYNTGEIDLSDRAQITADGDVAGNLWLYSSGSEIEFDGPGEDSVDDRDIRFTGVLYAPQSEAYVEGRVTFKGSNTFLSVNSGEADDNGNGGNDDYVDISFHYDEALQGSHPFGGGSVPVVSHLHVSRHRVVIETN
ncbi:archaellin/type IV pilin N-terminal domain-containing protein [Halorubrum rutilum]|uniref:Archaellin/type IV pilin N-terminal domain-containing protein n=1 Tax=Halorubrum rutilum TaxID=1364933 RepID=A0ABD6AJH2_9EURY|nr:archaellin/type IV pilin N-terminal domain-containing protein [Halorubrum rutilum]